MTLTLEHATRTAWTIMGKGANGCKEWLAQHIHEGYYQESGDPATSLRECHFIPALMRFEVSGIWSREAAPDIDREIDLNAYCPALVARCRIKSISPHPEDENSVLVVMEPFGCLSLNVG